MKQQLCTILLGEVRVEFQGEVFQQQLIKSAPSYAAKAIPSQVIVGQEVADIDGKQVTFTLRGYPPDILVIQSVIDVENLFQRDIFDLEAKIFQQSQNILKEYGGDIDYSEDYSLFIVTDYEGEPEQFLNKNASIIASLLKSERTELDPNEVEYTLKSQIKYAKNDLTIIDWDGAVVFDPVPADISEDLELLTLANLQLLRHRILDRQLEDQLRQMSNIVLERTGRNMLVADKHLMNNLKEIIRIRMSSISYLQRLERDIKLIGDWYSARYYDLASSKFKIEEWRKAIRSKLESLEDIYGIIAENFSVSAKHRAEWAQIIAFFILQVGWFIIIILEFFYFTRDH
jgi:hypothetical protein